MPRIAHLAAAPRSYQWWNFVPKLIWVEFSKLANVYFLVRPTAGGRARGWGRGVGDGRVRVGRRLTLTRAASRAQIICILQTRPQTTSTNGFPTTMPALVVVVSVSIIYRLHEDWQRHKADRVANGSPCLRRVDGAIQPAVWVDVKVGDVLRLTNRDKLPADVMLLGVSEPDASNPRGACHVETKGLDGETNLKEKSAPGAFVSMLGGDPNGQLSTFNGCRGYVECETPNAATNKFSGTLHLEGQRPVRLSIRNMLLRGSSLRNCEYAYGLVINTGVDTKVMQGARRPPLKVSTLDHYVNLIMIGVIILLLVVCVLAAALCRHYEDELMPDNWYLYDPTVRPNPNPPHRWGLAARAP